MKQIKRKAIANEPQYASDFGLCEDMVMFARQLQPRGSHNSHKSERYRMGLVRNPHVVPRGKLQSSRLLWLLHLPLQVPLSK